MHESGAPKTTSERQKLMKARQLRWKLIAAQKLVNASEEPKFNSLEIDDSLLGAVIDPSSSTEMPDPVYIGSKDMASEESRLLEDRLILVLEGAEEPSTHALSITDKEKPVSEGSKIIIKPRYLQCQNARTCCPMTWLGIIIPNRLATRT